MVLSIFKSIEGVWTNYENDEKRKSNDVESHPIFGKTIKINDNNIQIRDFELESIIENNGAIVEAKKVR